MVLYNTAMYDKEQAHKKKIIMKHSSLRMRLSFIKETSHERCESVPAIQDKIIHGIVQVRISVVRGKLKGYSA